MTIELEPFNFGMRDDEEDLPLAPSEQGSPLGPMLQPGQAADVMSQVGVEPPQQPYQPPPMPPALARQAAEAQQVGDAYRSNPANRQREPFGSAAAYQAGLAPDGQPRQPDGPQWPPAGAQQPAEGVPGLGDPRVRERLQQLLQARQAGAAGIDAQTAGRRRQGADAAGSLARGVMDVAGAPVDAIQQLARAAQAQGAQAQGQPAQGDEDEEEYDFTGADWADGIRRLFHTIGSTLTVASGRQAPQFRSIRSGIERRLAEERQRDDAQQQRDAQMGLQRERLDMQREAFDAQREDRALDREDRAADRDLRQQLSERQMQLAEQRGSVMMEVSRAQLRRTENEAQRDAAADDPASEPSRTARLALRTALAGYPAEARQRLAEQLGVEDLDAALGPDGTLSQRAADTLMRSMPSMFRDTTNRRGGARRGGGGGGGGGAAAQQALTARAEAAGLTAEQVASYGNDRRRLLAEIERREGEVRRGEAQADRAGQGTEILPGVRTSLALPSGEVTGIRSAIATAARSASNIRGLGEIHTQYGGLTARVSPEAQARITPRLTIARGMVATLGNTGVINPTEVPTINGALPNPADLGQMTFGTFNARMQEWQQLLEESIRSELASRGVDDAGIARVLSTIRAGSWSQGGGAQPAQQAGGGGRRRGGDTVRVRHPDGRTGTIPRANLERARQAGFEEVR